MAHDTQLLNVKKVSFGHLCMLTPKYHPELAFIEYYWAKVKRHLRARRDRSWNGMKKALWKAMNFQLEPGEPKNISSMFRQKAGRRQREYARAYLLGGTTVDNIDARRMSIKAQRKQHRGVCVICTDVRSATQR